MIDVPSSRPPKGKVRNFLWWVSAILTPFGVIGGPLAIADVLSGAIKWDGWVGYAVVWWHEKIGTPFGAVMSALFAKMGWPKPSEALIDYTAIGILLSAGLVRAYVVFVHPAILRELEEDQRGRGVLGPSLFVASVFTSVILPIIYLALWPLAVLAFGFFAYRTVSQILTRKHRDDDHAYSTLDHAFVQAIWLTFAPILIFLILWVINAIGG